MNKQLQVSNSTIYDRYPYVFSAVKEICEYDNIINIRKKMEMLSFGCSTGEEADCLSKEYFKDCNITATDIHKPSLDIARKNIINTNIKFVDINELKDSNKKFDVVFCMSVLCNIHG